ncbi:NADH kinase pos5, mitochondrial [Erysiphe necator]|nr:NADH kinase pos5, mitochondrial [Erysiphe necator]
MKRIFRNTPTLCRRAFSTTAIARKQGIRDVKNLAYSIVPWYVEEEGCELLSLKWPRPPQNILLIMKDGTPHVLEKLFQFAKHIYSNYKVSLLFESHVAEKVCHHLDFPIYTATTSSTDDFARRVDLTITLGGDGTILHAASLFSQASHVPPILSFSLGTLGFLGEWKFSEYKRAFREVFVSGAPPSEHPLSENIGTQIVNTNNDDSEKKISSGWSSIRGKSMGWSRRSKILLRNRVKVGVFDISGSRVSANTGIANTDSDICAMNEVIVYRGQEAQLAVIEIFVAGRFLTEAVGDGIIIATPTGSTAYSLSSGGSIVHPLVSSILVTPICPRSLSFRPIVLPANTPITLRLSERNRGRDLEVSIDGRRLTKRVSVGMEIRVCANDVVRGSHWVGGVPCVMRGMNNESISKDDGWVGGLNGLLKFNYPFGSDSND